MGEGGLQEEVERGHRREITMRDVVPVLGRSHLQVAPLPFSILGVVAMAVSFI
jgi:hypothetical protein